MILAPYLFLILSACVPIGVFSHIFIGKYYNTIGTHRVSTGHSMKNYRDLIESRIASHFQDSLQHCIVVQSQNEFLEGYFKSSPNGIYSFYGLNKKKVLELKKDNLGWALVKIYDGDDRKRKFITALILHLENKLFN